MCYAVHCVACLRCVLELRATHAIGTGHGAQARNLALRQRQLYGAVDAVLSPSAADLARVRAGVMG